MWQPVQLSPESRSFPRLEEPRRCKPQEDSHKDRFARRTSPPQHERDTAVGCVIGRTTMAFRNTLDGAKVISDSKKVTEMRHKIRPDQALMPSNQLTSALPTGTRHSQSECPRRWKFARLTCFHGAGTVVAGQAPQTTMIPSERNYSRENRFYGIVEQVDGFPQKYKTQFSGFGSKKKSRDRWIFVIFPGYRFRSGRGGW